MLSGFMEEPFEYGRHDCALFVCNCIHVMTGEDPAAAYRNRYRDRKGALKILKTGGLEGIVERIALSLGATEIEPRFAQRGDVVLVDLPVCLTGTSRFSGPALAIVDLTGEQAVGPAEIGMVSVKLSEARRAWRI